MSAVEVKTVGADDDGIRIDRWFKRHYPALSFGVVSKLMRTGQVRLDGKRVKPGDRIAKGQEVRVPPQATLGPIDGGKAAVSSAPVLSDKDRALLRDITLFSDDMVWVLNKPAGLPVQGGSGQDRHLDGLLAAWAGEARPRPKLVHRLDKDTSGVLVVGKTAKAAARLAEAFRSRNTVKTYWALVVGMPEAQRGRIQMKMDKLPGRTGERMVASDEGKGSVSDFVVVDHAGRKASWLALRPVTGRTHQLRLHCAEVGTPIVGDGKYGAKEAFLTGGISKKLHLHAHSLRMPHPRAGQLEVTAPLPDHMRASWDFLGFDAEMTEDPFEEDV